MNAKDMRPVLRVNDPCYFDSFSGPVACKVLSIEGESGPGSSSQVVTLKVTAIKSKDFTRGRRIITNGIHAIPRGALKRRRCGARITYYTVEVQS